MAQEDIHDFLFILDSISILEKLSGKQLEG